MATTQGDYTDGVDVYGTTMDTIPANNPGWIDQTGGTNPRAGIRIPLDDPIPQGSNIDTFTITFDENFNNGNPDCVFYLEKDSGNPSVWADYTAFNGATLTTANVAVTSASWVSNAWTTPDLSELLQEVVNLYEVATIHIQIYQNKNATVKFDTEGSAASGAKPTANVTYTENTTSIPVLVHHYRQQGQL